MRAGRFPILGFRTPMLAMTVVAALVGGCATDVAAPTPTPATTGTDASSSPDSAGNDKVVKIGIQTSLSPPGDHQLGGEAREAIEAFVEWNNSLDNGVTFEIVGVGDDQGDPATGNSNVVRLVNDGAQVIVGDMGSAIVQAALPTIQRSGTLMVLGGSQSNRITGLEYPTVFRVGQYDGGVAQGVVQYFKHLQETEGLQTVGLLTEDSAFGLSFSEAVPQEAADQGLDIEFHNVVFPQDATDVTPQLLAMTQADPAPDLVMINAVLAARNIAIRQAGEVGLTPAVPLLAEWNWPEYEGYWEATGSAGEGIRYVTYEPPDSPLNEMGQIFEEQIGTRPSIWAMWTWDAMLAVQQAALLAESSDTADLVDAMIEVDVEGATGRIAFSDAEDVTYHNRPDAPIYIVTLESEGDTADDAVLLFPN